MEYQEELARQLDEEIEGRRNDIEKAFKHEAEKLQRKAKQEISTGVESYIKLF